MGCIKKLIQFFVLQGDLTNLWGGFNHDVKMMIIFKQVVLEWEHR